MRSPEAVINGKIQVYSSGSAPAPGNCCCCGSVERATVDFGLDIEFYGRVLVCVECLREAVTLTSMDTDPETLRAASLAEKKSVDTEKVNEFLSLTNDLAGRLIHLLPDSYFNDLVDAPQDTESDDERSDGTVSKSSSIDDTFPELGGL